MYRLSKIRRAWQRARIAIETEQNRTAIFILIAPLRVIDAGSPISVTYYSKFRSDLKRLQPLLDVIAEVENNRTLRFAATASRLYLWDDPLDKTLQMFGHNLFSLLAPSIYQVRLERGDFNDQITSPII